MDPVVYSGRDVMANFFRHIFNKAKAITGILSRDMPIAPLTASETADFDSASTCANCGSGLSQTNPKTHHHNHVSTHYLFPACCKLNLAHKPRKCRVMSAKAADDNGWAFLVPIVFTICRLTMVTSCCSSFARNTLSIPQSLGDGICRRGRHSSERTAKRGLLLVSHRLPRQPHEGYEKVGSGKICEHGQTFRSQRRLLRERLPPLRIRDGRVEAGRDRAASVVGLLQLPGRQRAR